MRDIIVTAVIQDLAMLALWGVSVRFGVEAVCMVGWDDHDALGSIPQRGFEPQPCFAWGRLEIFLGETLISSDEIFYLDRDYELQNGLYGKFFAFGLRGVFFLLCRFSRNWLNEFLWELLLGERHWLFV